MNQVYAVLLTLGRSLQALILTGTTPGGRLLPPLGTESLGVPNKLSVPSGGSDRSRQ